MKLKFSAEEFCALCILSWPGPLPPFKGVEGVLPYGVKNVVKWKSQLSLKKLLKKEKGKLEQAGLLQNGELVDAMITIHFYQKCISIVQEEQHLISFYEAPEGYVSLNLSNNEDTYEIKKYETKKEMYNDFEQIGTDTWNGDYKGSAIKVYQRDEQGKVQFETIRNDSFVHILEELVGGSL